ncbi:hypothetical protein BN2476_110279 [Paraburkholderia piptadeniae]|uniref:Uncharacterized protein n=1 Tax=Paraburkholderia piptadeniae TaxID=1701573 RepID=A0A1N7RQL9_9BURK|nr:hypothetical protein BN2476_110279 [Paraburkholderia piptadeniae]
MKGVIRTKIEVLCAKHGQTRNKWAARTFTRSSGFSRRSIKDSQSFSQPPGQLGCPQGKEVPYESFDAVVCRRITHAVHTPVETPSPVLLHARALNRRHVRHWPRRTVAGALHCRRRACHSANIDRRFDGSSQA